MAPEPEPPRGSRHKAVNQTTTTESLRTLWSNAETPTTKVPAVAIKYDDHATKLADFYDSLEAIEEGKKRFALATVRVYSGALNVTNATERMEIMQGDVKHVSKGTASSQAKLAAKHVQQSVFSSLTNN